MMCKLGITFVDESKIYTWRNLARVAAKEQKRSWLVEVRRRKRSGFKHECLAAKHLNFERALDKCGHTAHYKELTETGNRA